MNKISIRLIHWNQIEAKERAALINKKYVTDYSSFSPDELKKTNYNPPTVFIIDLSRIPSQGRDLGIFLRKNKVTRNIPIIYIAGDPEKVKKLKAILPDAYYSSWKEIDSAINNSLISNKKNFVVPDSVFAGYEGVPLIKKLGIKPNSQVALINAPDDIAQILGELPEGVELLKKIVHPDLIIWFVSSIKELEKKVIQIKSNVGKNGLWIVHPKKSSKINSDINQSIVRNTGLAVGLVDFKVCSINETWTGLKFAVRKNRG